jgi:hypothetical protein
MKYDIWRDGFIVAVIKARNRREALEKVLYEMYRTILKPSRG